MNVSIKVNAGLKADGIRGEVSADGGIEIAMVIVVEPGLCIEVLARIYLDALFRAP